MYLSERKKELIKILKKDLSDALLELEKSKPKTNVIDFKHKKSELEIEKNLKISIQELRDEPQQYEKKQKYKSVEASVTDMYIKNNFSVNFAKEVSKFISIELKNRQRENNEN